MAPCQQRSWLQHPPTQPWYLSTTLQVCLSHATRAPTSTSWSLAMCPCQLNLQPHPPSPTLLDPWKACRTSSYQQHSPHHQQQYGQAAQLHSLLLQTGTGSFGVQSPVSAAAAWSNSAAPPFNAGYVHMQQASGVNHPMMSAAAAETAGTNSRGWSAGAVAPSYNAAAPSATAGGVHQSGFDVPQPVAVGLSAHMFLNGNSTLYTKPDSMTALG